MGYNYYSYTVSDYMANKLPTYRVTTPVASFNHVACSHAPRHSNLPVFVMYRCMESGVSSVVLRGCISFNPLYREYSLYSPKLFKHATIDPYKIDKWTAKTVFTQYQQYLNWLVAFVNEFTIIHYVELFNEYFFKGANYIPFNNLLLGFIMHEWNKLRPFMRKDVLWGVSEPLIGTTLPESHATVIDQWRKRLGLGYTGIQLHQNRDVIELPFKFAVTENYTARSHPSPSIIYHGY